MLNGNKTLQNYPAMTYAFLPPCTPVSHS